MPARSLVVFVLALLAGATHAVAQATDPSGHWEGSISAPFGEVPIAIDIGRNARGEPIAAYSRHDVGMEGFPLSDVEVAGNRVTFTINANGGGTFNGTVTGVSMTGNFVVPAGVVTFSLTRTGEGRFPPPPTSAAISRALEGTWTGGFDVGSDSFRVRITLTNQAGGSSIGTIVRLDDSHLELPVTIREEGRRVTIVIPGAGSSFAGTLNDAGTAIVGDYIERDLKTPLTFERQR